MPLPPPVVPFRCERIYHGGDYNPDQWPEAIWDEDVRLMREAGVNIATLPVFGWQALNPAEGVFTFDWLDRIMAKLDAADIDLCLATATASQPAWLDQKYPDALAWDDHGRRRPHGNRHTFCPHSPNLHRLRGELVRALADRYGRHPRVKLWHINNEYGGSWPQYCYCPNCAGAFRHWLEKRHGSLAALNAHWNTAFWGHTYDSFAQVEPPYAHGEGSIPVLRIDWRRFHNESLLACYRQEVAILRALSPGVPITTNLMGPFMPLDYRKWAPHLDVISWDSYPRWNDPPAHTAFKHALTRGLRDGDPFLLLEQSPSHQNWSPTCRLKRPGELRQLSLQALAHGSDSVMYFQWRQNRAGIEKYHGAVIEHHGRPDARVFREVSALGAELARLGRATLAGRTPARAAVLFDWESWWALDASSGPRRQLDYHAEVLPYYTALHTAGIPTDVIGLDADLDRYDVIIAPWLTLLDERDAARLETCVQAGASLIATHFTGRVDVHDRFHPGGAPGPLRRVLGLTVEEYDALADEETNGVRFTEAFGPHIGAGESHAAGFLCERLWLQGARALAHYTDDFYAGEAAVTVHAFGRGHAYYLATKLAPAGLSAFLRGVCARQDITSTLPDGAPPPAGVEATLRTSPEGAPLLYLINHAGTPQEIPLPAGHHENLLTGERHTARLTLAPRDGVILRPLS